MIKRVCLIVLALIPGCIGYGACVCGQASILVVGFDYDGDYSPPAFKRLVKVWEFLVLGGAPVFLYFWVRWILRVNLKHPHGHCACGCNLTGNVSRRCPECGVDVDARRSLGSYRNGTA